MASKIDQVVTIGLIAAAGFLILSNWGSLKTIGSKVNSGISAGLTKLAGSEKVE